MVFDGGPEFTATDTGNILVFKDLGVYISSTAFPRSNCRAEVGVKTVKCFITDNTGPNDELDTQMPFSVPFYNTGIPLIEIRNFPRLCVFLNEP